MRCKECDQEMNRKVSFDPDGSGMNVIHSCPSQCQAVITPLTVDDEEEPHHMRLVVALAEYTGKTSRDVIRVLVGVGKKAGTIDLEAAEEPLGLPAGFFDKAIAG